MDNVYTNKINELYLKEQQLNAKVEECQENATNALAELHQALIDLNDVKTAEKAVFVDLNTFIERIQQSVIKVNVSKVSAKKQELLNLMESVSWEVSRILELSDEMEKEISRQND